jgi:hypothetical protein
MVLGREDTKVKTRPLNSRLCPWYDSVRPEKYTRAKQTIQRVNPSALNTFEDAIRPSRTHAEFRVSLLDRIVDDVTLEKIRHIMKALRPMQFELHEVQQFKRFIVHDHPYFTELQQQLTDLMSESVNEPVEPSYNFLSLYTGAGICPVHMDSSGAKWTLDICLNQSEAWPLWISNVQPWPEDWFDISKLAQEASASTAARMTTATA